MGERVYPSLPYAYVDMDGVTADYDAAATAAGIAPEHYKRIAGAYYGLPIFPGAAAALQALRDMGYQVWLLTKIPSCNPHAATEKLLWVRRHLPCVGENVIISPNKGALGRPGDILIDDHPQWANCAQFGGKVLHFTGSWEATIIEARAHIECGPQRAAAPEMGLA
jgi:5'-nucleotidase